MPITDESLPIGQAAHAHDRYMEGADGLTVQTDLDERVAAADSTHTEIENSALDTDLNVSEVVHPWGTVKTYAGGNIVTYAGEGTRTKVEEIVATAIAADALFATGPGFTSPVEDTASAYVDPLFLIEASKLVGTKFF